MNYKFEVLNNHLVIENEEGKNYLVDTGAPVSIPFTGSSITVSGETFKKTALGTLESFGVSAKSIEELVGKKMDGIIGMDILEHFGGATFDKGEGLMHFGASEKEETDKFFYYSKPFQREFEMLPGVFRSLAGEISNYITTMVTVNGKEVRAIFDTGANVGYVSKDIVENRESTTVIRDYAPSFGGNIEVPGYELPVTIDKEPVVMTVGEYNTKMKSLDMLNIRMVFGFREIFKEKLVIDTENQRIIYK